MKDLIYYYDKTTFKQYEFGEIQTDFNMSKVIDGTKDSCKINVVLYQEKEITPNTIVWHKATNTWWIVGNDKVGRYENESGWYFKHELQLEGAIELLNARDLTDIGFNANRYTISSFIDKLFMCSNFEYPIIINYNGNLSHNKIVDYIKTFENYTLLSALREFLDGYNCVAKLSFTTSVSGNDTYINYAKIDIISKSGNVNVSPRYANDVFKDVREIRNTNKSSYGTSVISNAENVVSTKTKTYPSAGGVKLSSKTYIINGETGILRLPSNAFKVNYVDMFNAKVKFGYIFQGSDVVLGTYDSSDIKSCQNAYNTLVSYLQSHFSSVNLDDLTLDLFTNYKIRIPYCDNYNPVTDDFIIDQATSIIFAGVEGLTRITKKLVICTQELKETLKHPKTAISYKRGENIIGVFDIFQFSDNKELQLDSVPFTTIINTTAETAGGTTGPLYIFVGYYKDIEALPSPELQIINIKDAIFSLNYIPMSDIKIKMDNYGDTIDSVLYNQNGKLTDSNSLSKVLTSYAKEIESDTITRYGTYYGKYTNGQGFDNGGMPNVGDLIVVNNEYYVINNISIDITPNESENGIGYYMTCEVSLSKRVATKSMLTSPNTNIRDYGIPQNNNVKRKQLYRDFYEFDYESIYNNGDTPNWYQPISNILNLSNESQEYKEHIAVINTTFNENVNGSRDYYYQLETTTYFLKKSIYEIVDFKDNNIIGYGFQNLWSGFDISKIFFSGNDGNYNTPISYVDNNGELKGIDIKMANIEQIYSSYENLDTYDSHKTYNIGDKVYRNSKVYTCNTNNTTGSWDSNMWTDNGDYSIYNASVFIPQDIFDYFNPRNTYDFRIHEQEYYKDALEVPVFEYSCQVDDTENVIVGENILNKGNDEIFCLYSYILTFDNAYDDNNYMNLSNYIPTIDVNPQNQAQHTNAVRFDFSHLNDNIPYFTLKLYESEIIDVDDNQIVSLGNEVQLNDWFDRDLTLLVVRQNLTNDDLYTNIVGELAINEPQATLPTANATYRNKIVVLDNGDYAICEPDQYSFSLSYGSNCSVKLTYVRENMYIYNNTTLTENVSMTSLQDDTYSWVATPDTDYYIDGDTSDRGTISAYYSHSITALHYQTIYYQINNGIDFIQLELGGVSRTLVSNGYIYNQKQDTLYSYETSYLTGWEESSGGSQTATPIGSNPSNLLIISPTAQRKTVTLTASISGGGSGSISITYRDPDTNVETTTTLNNGNTLTLKYGTEYVWEAVANTGSYISGNAGGRGTVGLSNIPLSTSFELNVGFTFRVLQDSHTFARVKIYRGTFELHSDTVIPNTSITYTDLRPTDTYDVKIEPWGTAYYIPSTETTYYSEPIGSGADISSSAVALRYRTISIYWAQGLLSVTITKSGETPQTYNNPNPYGTPSSIPTVVDDEVEQGLSYSYTTSVANGFMAISDGIGSWNSSTGDWSIQPDVVITPTINQVTLGNLYEQPTLNSWKSILTVYPNFKFSTPMDKSLISSIVVKMYIYYGPGSGQVIESYTKTYSANDLSVNSSNWLYASYSMYNPIIDWNGTSLSGRGAWVGNAVSQSSNTCKIEVTVNYVDGQSRTKSIGGTFSFLARTGSSGNYLAHFDGQTSLKYRANTWGVDSFDQGENSIARWYILS